jgi:hypothetical protein
MSIQVLKRIVVPAGKFASEEKATSCGLPAHWKGVKSVGEQVGILSDLLKTKPDAEARRFLQEGLPRWFELEWPEWIDGFFVHLNPLTDYCAKLSERVIPALAKKFAERDWIFTNHRKGQLGDDRLQLNEQTTATYQGMAKLQKGNFWFMPMSLANGKRYPGKTCSPRRYLELAGKDEFGYGPSEGLCAVLTHFDERVQPGKVFRLDFPGAKYNYSEESERWSNVSCLFWYDGGEAGLGAGYSGACNHSYDSVLGRLPQFGL